MGKLYCFEWDEWVMQDPENFMMNATGMDYPFNEEQYEFHIKEYFEQVPDMFGLDGDELVEFNEKKEDIINRCIVHCKRCIKDSNGDL